MATVGQVDDLCTAITDAAAELNALLAALYTALASRKGARGATFQNGESFMSNDFNASPSIFLRKADYRVVTHNAGGDA